MKKFLYFCLVASIALNGLTCVNAMEENSSESEEYVTLAPDLSDSEQNLTNTRTARILKYPRSPSFTIRRRKPVNIRSRADHYPILTQLRRVQNNALPQNQPLRYGYDSLKSSKYNLASKGAYGNSAKGTSLRHQLLSHVHPNGVHVPALSQQYVQNFKASPSYNGKVIVHPVTANQQSSQQQQQQQQKPGQQDTKYPKYIKPPPPQQKQQQQQHQQLPQTHHHHQQQLGQQQQQQPPSVGVQSQYPDFKQFPIPDEQQMQKYNEQHEKYLQQQKYLSSRDPVAYYQQQYSQASSQPQQAQQLQPFQYPYSPQQNYNAVQQPSYVAPKPVVTHTHPPAIPIHQISSDSLALQSHHGYTNSQLSSTAAPPHQMYSVYEENDMTELQNNNYQTAAYESLEKEAQEYLRFMNTNEYFLPKRDPNYRLQDEENDRRQQYNQRLQSSQRTTTQTPVPYTAQSQFYQQAAQQQQQQQQQQQHNDYNYQNTYAQQQQPHEQPLQLFSPNLDSSSASSYQQPIKASQLFYPDDSSLSTSQHGQPSTVVKTSYQTGYNANQIVVSSQDHKTSKYIGNGQNSIVVSTQSPVVSVNNIYSQVRQSPQQKGRTPEPLRFEFTERDAMVGGLSYTYAPTTGHLRYKAVELPPVTPKLPTTYSTTPSTTVPVLSTTLRTSNYHSSGGGIKPVLEVDDDPEDEDDMQHAGSNLYGRQPLLSNNNTNNKSTHLGSTTESPSATSPSDQKDTEEYCERICAIVEDEHEEIVCGSDGYMYTSEAQMECYASCLHIDVTIQGKGSCSAR